MLCFFITFLQDSRCAYPYLAGRPLEIASADEVEVKVKDRLAAARADVEDGTVSVFYIALASEFGGDEVAVADDLGVGRAGLP